MHYNTCVQWIWITVHQIQIQAGSLLLMSGIDRLMRLIKLTRVIGLITLTPLLRWHVGAYGQCLSGCRAKGPINPINLIQINGQD